MGTLTEGKVFISASKNVTHTVNTMSSGAKPKILQKTPSSAGSRSADQRRNRSNGPVLPSKRSHTTVSSAQSKSRPSSSRTKGTKNHTKDEGQDVVFTNVPSLRENLEQKSEEEPRHSTERRIVPQEVLDKSQESSFQDVYEIDLNSEHIIRIENLEKFTKVRILDLSSNYIRRLENLDALTDLRDLKLYNNQIDIVQNLDKLTELCTLHLQGNKIKQLGRGLLPLKKLKVLRLDSNYLHKIEVKEVASLSQLLSLDVSSNAIEDLSTVCCLNRLEELYATHNRLRVLPDLSRCKNLSEVDVSNNRITDLSGLKGLQKLTVLHASHNLLTSHHMKTISKLKNLEELHISHNRITDLHTWLPQHPQLQILDVQDNKVHAWSTVCQLRSMEELVEVYLAGNPFCGEKGEKPHYFMELQTIIPQLQIIDGAHTKHTGSPSKRPTTPLMRPMSASSAVSSRQVEGQIQTLTDQLAQFEAALDKQFVTLRSSFGVLPETSQFDSSRSGVSVVSTASGRPISKCSQRSRIQDALSFAAQQDLHEEHQQQQESK